MRFSQTLIWNIISLPRHPSSLSHWPGSHCHRCSCDWSSEWTPLSSRSSAADSQSPEPTPPSSPVTPQHTVLVSERNTFWHHVQKHSVHNIVQDVLFCSMVFTCLITVLLEPFKFIFISCFKVLKMRKGSTSGENETSYLSWLKKYNALFVYLGGTEHIHEHSI